MRRAVVLFTRDLRLHDHPALSAASCAAEQVLPLFVLDDRLLRDAAPVRVRFLLEALEDLDASLRSLGARLVVRRGDPVEECVRVAEESGAEAVFLSGDVSELAHERERRLREATRVPVTVAEGVTVVPPGELAPSGGDCYRRFTAYWRRWSATGLRQELPPPTALRPVPRLRPGRLPSAAELGAASEGKRAVRGGESAALARLAGWMREGGPAGYEGRRDLLGAPAGSGLSPYLHLGCLSPLTLARRVTGEAGGEGFLRQLCWRDFFHQLLDARPELAHEDMRPGRRWIEDPEALEAWREGRTGLPLVDAGMRQLAAEGWLANRARLVTASFLTKHLGLDWRLGADHYRRLLVDGDLAVNSGNWQWVAGTGADTRPRRLLNPTVQAKRHDPDGAYVRRWVAELSSIPGTAVHEPWALGRRSPRGYPAPIVDLHEARARFLELG